MDARLWRTGRSGLPPWLIVGLVLMLLAAATALVYITGGTAYAWPYTILIPVLVAAAWFGIAGGVLAGVVAGLLLGPYMPLDVAGGEPQSTYNWLTRLAAYVGLGGLSGWLFERLERSADEERRAARTDSGTGLANQAALQGDLGRSGYGTAGGLRERSVALILIRATDLAEVQEVVGADAASHIFPTTAARLRDADDRCTAVYRFSHSELALVVDAPDAEQLNALVSKALAAVEMQGAVRGIPVRLEWVAGAALADENWVDGLALIRRARIALMAAINAGSRSRLYNPGLECNSAESVHLVARLRSALEAGERDVHYQPKVRLVDGARAGCEGLIRWQTAEAGMIPPAQFMPKVERTSLIRPLTEFVVEHACSVAARAHCRPVSVNFSVRNLFDGDMIDYVERRLDAHDLRGDELEIEITEGALMHSPGEAVRLIGRLRGLGIGVSIDDFGTGYSSFEYLRRLPVTGLKIDRAFVRDIASDARSRDLLACMVQAGHALDLEVTAEGVETDAQHEQLRALGCDLAQGFLYARPMPQKALLEWAPA